MVGGPGFEPGNSGFEAETVTSYVSRPLARPEGIEPPTPASETKVQIHWRADGDP
jgi:hypothetical protein